MVSVAVQFILFFPAIVAGNDLHSLTYFSSQILIDLINGLMYAVNAYGYGEQQDQFYSLSLLLPPSVTPAVSTQYHCRLPRSRILSLPVLLRCLVKL